MENQQNVKDKDFYLNKGNIFTDEVARKKRRIEFQEYLDRTGVSDKLTEIFMDLYENPIMDYPVLEYLRMRLVVPNPDVEEIEKLRPKLEAAKSYRDYMKKENKHLIDTFKDKNYTLPEGIAYNSHEDSDV